MGKKLDNHLIQLISYFVAAILVFLPFHTLLTTWVGSNYGHLDLFRIWKELLLIPISLVALLLVLKDKKWRLSVFGNLIIKLIIAYAGLNLALGAVAFKRHDVNANALIYGLLNGLRFLVIFAVCYALSLKDNWLKAHWQKLLLLPAAAVVVFGLVQHFLLPADFLRHFGYGPATIPAYQTVDLRPNFVRLQATLRGPNPLGAYLVLVLSALAVTWQKVKSRRLIAVAGLLACITLFFTYSRSAYIGLGISLLCLAWLALPSRLRPWLLTGFAVIAIVGAGSLLALRNNDRFQNVVFHSSEKSTSSTSSNSDRASALEHAVKDVANEPLGRGPGTAGPASVRNDNRVRIAENYFLQVGQESGVLGLGLFIGINALVGLGLYKRRSDPLALALLASLAGLTFINLVSHAWADDTLALLWWPLAGLALGTNQSQKPKS